MVIVSTSQPSARQLVAIASISARPPGERISARAAGAFVAARGSMVAMSRSVSAVY